MPKTLVMAQCERRLDKLGCPLSVVRHEIRELADHHEDLKQEAREEGLSEADAEARADERLGDPIALAECLAAALRQSSWWGRHPVLGFCALPPFAILAFLAIGLCFDSLLGRFYFTPEQLSALEGEPGMQTCAAFIHGTYYVAMIFATVLFCRLARRTVKGFRWAFVASLVCAVNGLLFYVSVVPHQLNVGYSSDLRWLGSLIPLATCSVFWIKRRWIGRLAARAIGK